MEVKIYRCDVCHVKSHSDETLPGNRLTGAYKSFDGQTFQVCENCQDDMFSGKAGHVEVMPEGMTSVNFSYF